MSYDHVHVLQKLSHACIVNPVTFHHLVGDVVHCDGGGGNGKAWVFQRVQHIHHAVDHACDGIEFKGQHAQLNHAVLGHVKAGGLGVEHHAFAELLAGGGGVEHTARHEAAKHAVVWVLFELLGELFDVLSHRG